MDRTDLDAVSRDHPILLVHVAAHWGVTNSAGLAAGGHREQSRPPPGGDLGRDGAGRLNGILYEQALFDYCYPAVARGGSTVIPESSDEDRARSLARFTAQLHAAGLTSVTDALSGPAELRLFSAREQPDLRINALLGYPHLDRLTGLGLSTGFGDEWFRICGIKAFADGAVAGRTCLVEEPFEGTEDHGIQVTSDEDLRELAMRAQAACSTLAVHANGDRAIAKLLQAIEAAQAARPRPGLRHRIEHCTMITPAIVDSIRRFEVIAVPFGNYVAYHGEKLLAWYGAERLQRMFAHRSLLDAGVTVAGSSDYPCGPYEPLLALQSCVTRESDGQVLGGSQRITPREALALYTTGAAASTGEERVKGRLAPGYLADFTVLDEDPLRADPRRLASLGIRSTWVAGQCVWPRLPRPHLPCYRNWCYRNWPNAGYPALRQHDRPAEPGRPFRAGLGRVYRSVLWTH